MKKHLFALTALATLTTFAMAAGSATAEDRLQAPRTAQAGHYVNVFCNPNNPDCNTYQEFAEGLILGQAIASGGPFVAWLGAL